MANACKWCHKYYNHHSSRARHAMSCTYKPHKKPPKDIFDKYEDHDEDVDQSVMETEDLDESDSDTQSEKSFKSEESDDNGDEEEIEENKKTESPEDDHESLDAWKIIATKTILRIAKKYPDITEKEAFKEPFFSQKTLKVLWKILSYHLTLAHELEQSDLFLSLKNTKTRLEKEGIPTWEASLAALDKRKHAIRGTLNDAMTFENDESDMEDEEEEEEDNEEEEKLV